MLHILVYVVIGSFMQISIINSNTTGCLPVYVVELIEYVLLHSRELDLIGFRELDDTGSSRGADGKEFAAERG